MKKILFFAALSSVALASCVSDESPSIDATPSGKAITFNAPVMYSQTKAVGHTGEIVGTYPQDENFTVFGVWSEGNFVSWANSTWYMGNTNAGVEVTHTDKNDTSAGDNGAWEPVGNAYYWPKKGYLNFAAYSPSGANSHGTITYGPAGLSITNFKVQSDAANQYDLMYSERVFNKNSSVEDTNNTYDGVNILFKHALSSIKFKVKTEADYTGTTITLTGITVNGVYEKGTFAENVTDQATYSASPEWTGQTDIISSSYTAYPKAASQKQVVNYNSGTAQDLDDGTYNNLIVMPQTLPDGAKLTITYTLKSPTGQEINQSGEATIKSLTPTWEIGTRYTYTIIFGLQKIYFAPSVDPWTDESKDINI